MNNSSGPGDMTPNIQIELPSDPASQLREATDFFQNGELEKAETIYREILEKDPENADALHLLGLLADQLGFMEEAAELIENALVVTPKNPMFLDNLSMIYNELGRVEEAEKVLRRSLDVEPDNPETLNNLGNLLVESGTKEQQSKKIFEAEKFLRRAVSISPDRAIFHNNLGNLFKVRHDLEQAKIYYNQALELDPQLPGALNNLGIVAHMESELDEAISFFQRALEMEPDNPNTHNNLAEVLSKKRELDKSVTHFERAIELTEENALIYFNMGNVLQRRSRYEDSMDALLKSMELKPDFPQVHASFGRVLTKMDLLDEAEAFLNGALKEFSDHGDILTGLATVARLQFNLPRSEELLRKVLKQYPHHAGALLNLAQTLYMRGKLEESMEVFDQTIEKYPELPDIHFNYSLVLFSAGNLEEAWKEYEYRWETDGFTSPVRAFPQPQWDGSSLEGKSIILWGEQGLADEIRYAGMVPEMLNRGADVHIECRDRLVDLFARSFEGTTVHAAHYEEAEFGEVDFDFQCPIVSLGQFLRPTIDSFPKNPHVFLKPDPIRKQFWQDRFAEIGPRPKVGILWRSMMRSSGRDIFYTTIKQLEPILTLPGVDFINLQYDECSEELAEAADLFGVKIHDWDDINLKDELDDVAALISGLDLVISYTSSCADMASALGVPVFEFISDESHFVMLGTGGAIWSPGITMFSKKPGDPWGPVLDNIAEATKQKFGLSA